MNQAPAVIIPKRGFSWEVFRAADFQVALIVTDPHGRREVITFSLDMAERCAAALHRASKDAQREMVLRKGEIVGSM